MSDNLVFYVKDANKNFVPATFFRDSNGEPVVNPNFGINHLGNNGEISTPGDGLAYTLYAAPSDSAARIDNSAMYLVAPVGTTAEDFANVVRDGNALPSAGPVDLIEDLYRGLIAGPNDAARLPRNNGEFQDFSLFGPGNPQINYSTLSPDGSVVPGTGGQIIVPAFTDYASVLFGAMAATRVGNNSLGSEGEFIRLQAGTINAFKSLTNGEINTAGTYGNSDRNVISQGVGLELAQNGRIVGLPPVTNDFVNPAATPYQPTGADIVITPVGSQSGGGSASISQDGVLRGSIDVSPDGFRVDASFRDALGRLDRRDLVEKQPDQSREETRQDFDPSSGDLVQERTKSFDPAGNLTRERTTNPADGTGTSTDYGRDANGNPTSNSQTYDPRNGGSAADVPGGTGGPPPIGNPLGDFDPSGWPPSAPLAPSPSDPSPPAPDTAAAKAGVDTPAIGAWMSGTLIPKRAQNACAAGKSVIGKAPWGDPSATTCAPIGMQDRGALQPSPHQLPSAAILDLASATPPASACS